MKISSNVTRLIESYDYPPLVATYGTVLTPYGVVIVSAEHNPETGRERTRLDCVANGHVHIRTFKSYYSHRYVSRLCREFAKECGREAR